MAFENQAAWLTAKGSKLSVGPADLFRPGPHEVLIKNRAWAINPIDWKMQEIGLFIDTYPVILGNDIAGDVVEIGSEVSEVQVADRVIAHPLGLSMKKQSGCGFQLYTVLPVKYVAVLPNELGYERAAQLPLSVLTASAGLFNSINLQLPPPSLNPVSTGKTLLVWGGSSSVGVIAVQLAIASGLEVVTTASKHNHDLLLGLGASKVFDHSSPTVVAEIVSNMKGKNASIVGAFDAIGDGQATMHTAEVLAGFGGGKLASVLNNFEGLPDSVSAKHVFAPSIFCTEPTVGETVWNKFLPFALQTGQVKPVLKSLIAGRGLGAVQTGINLLKEGVSATKVVVLADV